MNGSLINSYYDRVGFAYRNQLPNKSSIEYSLVCANDTSTKFTREWKIGSPYYHAFNTSNDYWNTFCLNKNITSLPDQEENISGNDLKPNNMQESVLVYNSPLVNFFILSDNKTGVVAMQSVGDEHTDMVDEMFNLQHGFKLLEDMGVQKVSAVLKLFI